MKKAIILSIVLIGTMILSCTKQHDGIDFPDSLSLDEMIDSLLLANNLSKGDFTLPRYGSWGELPQSMDNKITEQKVKLGASIFWDPVWLQNGEIPGRAMTASCGSCHIKDGHVGLPQGIGEGGDNTGTGGIARTPNPNVTGGIQAVDGQGRRAPTNMHVAYKPNVLWDGVLGSPDMNKFINSDGLVNRNEGLTAPDPFIEMLNTTFTGFGGAEMQGLAGLTAHRMRFNEEIINRAGSKYRELFEAVFGDDGETPIKDFVATITDNKDEFFVGDEFFIDFEVKGQPDGRDTVPIQFSKLAAAMAVAAYNRHLVADDAPFQKYLRGDLDAISEQEKRGFKVFVERKCVNCHNGPALTDANFHRMGVSDLSSDFTGNPIAGHDPNGGTTIDQGRINMSNNADDQFKFLTPTLYNVPAHVFHGGETGGAAHAVNYMLNRELTQNYSADEDWEDNSDATSQEREDLIAFIDKSLRDLEYDRKYRPGTEGGLLSPVYSADNTAGENGENIQICSPNNDEISQSSFGVICN